MQLSEKQLSTKSSPDSFDEIYTNFDLSVNEEYSANDGYPFDYPTRWLNDPSMNKRIAIRRLDVTPSSHSFTLIIKAKVDEDKGEEWDGRIYLNVTHNESLIQVLDALCQGVKYEIDGAFGGLQYDYDAETCRLVLWFSNSKYQDCPFQILDGKGNLADDSLVSFMKFLNQEETIDGKNYLETLNTDKVFNNVWNRDRLHFHATFSNSRRQFIGKRGDFYQNLTLLYPPPTNESTFYIRFTSNGIKNILLRYCEFDVQLCFIINYKKATVL